jgi:hypothetical protein
MAVKEEGCDGRVDGWIDWNSVTVLYLIIYTEKSQVTSSSKLLSY